MATRRERVILELEDNFTSGMARAAAATAVLDKSLNSLSGSAVDTRKSVLDLNRQDGLPGLAKNSESAGRQIDRMSGRLTLMAQAAAVLGPALVPIGAVAIPAVAGLAAQLGFAALAGGTAIVAFQGVGDALKAMNTAHLEPTAENLEAAREAMRELSPAAREFVVEARQMIPALKEIRDAAAEGMFPGLLDGMAAIEARLPDVERILRTVGEAVGEILGDTGESLASARWDDFFDFLATDATSALGELASSVGNVTHGLAEMWMAFDPLNDSFSSWLVQVTEDFDSWATTLSQTNGFTEFVEYIRDTGPQVAEALGAIGSAVVQIVQATAPLGGVALQGLEAFGDVVAAIADSDLGTPIFAAVAAMSALSLATKAWGAVGLTAAGSFVKGQIVAQNAMGQTYVKMAGLGKAGAALAGLTLASADMADSFELSNTASMALIGTMAGPWGTAAGAAAGFAMDFAKAGDDMAASLERVNQAFESGTIGEQKAALRDLKATTDEASAGFVELFKSVDDDGESGLRKLGSSIIPAAFSAFNVLTGATREAREEYESYRGSVGGSDIGRMLAAPLGLAEDAFLNANAALEQFEDSFRRLNNLLTRSSTLIAYEQALDDLTASVKENGDAWDKSTDKGRANLLARNRLVETAIDRSQALREEGDKLGAQRILQRAMKDLQSFGNDSPKAKAAVRDLIAELERLDNKHAEPEVDANTKPAKEKLSQAEKDLNRWDASKGEATATVNGQQALATLFGIKGALDRIQSKTVFVNVMTRRSSEGGGTGLGPVDYATGGFTGAGGKYEPAGIVHRGEVVIPQEYVKRDWSMLKSRYGNLPGFADGGLATGTKMSDIRGDYGLSRVARAAERAAGELDRGAHASRNEQRERMKELRQRERLFTKELEHAEKKMQAELDALKELKAARRELMDAVSGNFMSSLFGGMDLKGAYESGALGSGFGQAMLAWVQSDKGPGLSGGPMSQYVDDYLATLTPAQLQALQGQATAGTLANDARNAQQFQAALQQLTALGLDGGLFQELAASGDIGAAEYYATLTKAEIRKLERQYDIRNQAAQSVGAYVGNAEFKADIREQTKVFREARDDMRDAKQELRQLNRRIDHLEKLAERNPKDTGRETAKALNHTAANANRRAG